jgi:two-component system CheB/CheR fusion protein
MNRSPDFNRRGARSDLFVRPGGVLFMGPSESLAREARPFTVVDKKHHILRRPDTIGATIPELHRAVEAIPTGPQPLLTRIEDRIDRSARRVTDKYSPAYIVIDKNYDILRFSGGEAAPYLEPSPGAASLNLFSLLRRTLRAQTRAALQKAGDSNQTVIDDNLIIDGDGIRRTVALIVEPIAESEPLNRLFVIAFREHGRLPDGPQDGCRPLP